MRSTDLVICCPTEAAGLIGQCNGLLQRHTWGTRCLNWQQLYGALFPTGRPQGSRHQWVEVGVARLTPLPVTHQGNLCFLSSQTLGSMVQRSWIPEMLPPGVQQELYSPLIYSSPPFISGCSYQKILLARKRVLILHSSIAYWSLTKKSVFQSTKNNSYHDSYSENHSYLGDRFH